MTLAPTIIRHRHTKSIDLRIASSLNRLDHPEVFLSFRMDLTGFDQYTRVKHPIALLPCTQLLWLQSHFIYRFKSQCLTDQNLRLRLSLREISLSLDNSLLHFIIVCKHAFLGQLSVLLQLFELEFKPVTDDRIFIQGKAVSSLIYMSLQSFLCFDLLAHFRGLVQACKRVFDLLWGLWAIELWPVELRGRLSLWAIFSNKDIIFKGVVLLQTLIVLNLLGEGL